MGEIKNLSGDNAVEKIKELAKEKICLFCTYTGDSIVSRPMSTQEVDDEGNLWFISNKESIKNLQIKRDSRVHLMYSNDSKHHYLSLSGYAELLDDKQKIEELWNPFINAWFEEGKNDPNVSVIKVVPEEGHYWDTQNGKLLSLLKIAVATITGKEMDGSVEGDLDV